MVKLEIDGQELEVDPGFTIIEAADDAKISIPRFCYHKKLSIAANCRMCLVEVEKAPKPMPACATPVAEGMVIKTKSPAALMAQRSVMEFLLINHPLDCPICDQGGECELQDVSMGYGSGISSYNQGKRSVKDENIGPLIATGMTRCIHCTRCVRFGEEVAGVKELGMINRGEHSEIKSFLNGSVDSELSGNMIDLCPVGALTSKPYRFSARTWELQQRASVAAHDFIGSNIYIHSKNHKIKRVVPKHTEDINENWLSDRDRFAYEGINHQDRLLKPLIRVDNKLQETDWETALEAAAGYIKHQVEYNPEDLVALLSSSSTQEEAYLLQKILNKLGSSNLYSNSNKTKLDRIKLGSDNISLAELEYTDNILLIGGNYRKNYPLLNHRIRKAFLNGCKINVINFTNNDYNYDLNILNIISADKLLVELSGVVHKLFILNKLSVPSILSRVKVSDYSNKLAEDLFYSRKPVVIIDDLILNHPDSDLVYNIFLQIKKLLNSSTIVCSSGANSVGLSIVAKLNGLDKGELSSEFDANNNVELNTSVDSYFSKPDDIGTYIIFNTEPELDGRHGEIKLKKLKTANKVVCFSSYITDAMHDYADVVLPVALFAETSGTFVNMDYKWQSFEAAVSADKICTDSQVRPAWRVFSVVAQLLDLPKDDFVYNSSVDIKNELLELLKNKKLDESKLNLDIDLEIKQEIKSSCNIDLASNSGVAAILISETNCYQTDSVVRRSDSLQQTADAQETNVIYLSENIIDTLGGIDIDTKVKVANANYLDHEVELQAKINNSLSDNTAYLSSGSAKTLYINDSYIKIVIKKVS